MGLAFAQECHNQPTKVKVFMGEAGHMVMLDDGDVSYHAASQTFVTPLGDIQSNPGQALSTNHDIQMLLAMTSTFVDRGDLELVVLQALGLIVPAETTTLPVLLGEWHQGKVTL